MKDTMDPKKLPSASRLAGTLQRKCAGCGNHTVAGGECEECNKKSSVGLQAKLNGGDAGDVYELEADRVADQAIGTSGYGGVGGAPSQIQRHAGGETTNSLDVPPIVHKVLNSPGQSLDTSTRAFMEARIGHDFSQVRVHTDTPAAESARAVSAQAYTLGRDVVFGAGQFSPETSAGRHLLAHELMHVAQRGGSDHHGSISGIADANSAAEHAAESAAAAIIGGGAGALVRGPVPSPVPLAGMIARQPDPADKGWSDAPSKGLNESVTTVDEKGVVAPGKTASKGVWRVPLQGFSKHGLQKGDKGPAFESAGGKAVALIPNTVSVAAPAEGKEVAVDVLLHFHGFGVGYRELTPGKKDFAKVLEPAQLRDQELYQMESQLLAHVKASNRLVIALLPQGTETSGFGDIGSNSEEYLKDAFTKLVPRYLPSGAIPGRLIVSGHSGGGPTAMSIAKQRAKAGKRTDVLLFDAINSSCSEKEPLVKDGKPVMKKDQPDQPVMVCKKDSPCASNEYNTASGWVKDRLSAEVKTLAGLTENEQITELQTNGTRFRGITSGSLKTTDTCSYGHWYNKLKNDIETTIKSLKVTEPVRNQFRKNYKVEEAQGLAGLTKKNEPHERVMGKGNLEAALKD